jgi:2-methylcitrate dehydratase PrpD
MGLNEKQTWNALALAFNKCGASFQANVDGALAVRVIEGWVAETGITCTRLALRGITGPANFIDGIYGYLHLFGRDRIKQEDMFAGLGEEYRVKKLVFKKYPSCGLTQGSTDVILGLMSDEGFGAQDVERIEIIVPPYTYKLVGHPFQLGDNPKVNAQFSIRYCVANALMRKGSKLADFEEVAVKNSEVLKLAERIDVKPDETMELRGHTPLDMHVFIKEGKEYVRKIDFVPGFPEQPLTENEHRMRFDDCLAFAQKPLLQENVEAVVKGVAWLESMHDVRDLIPLLTL